MLIHILAQAGLRDFGYMPGGSFQTADLSPARLNAPGTLFVTEACEAHGALGDWQPGHIILTNADDDHADHYGGPEGLRQAFATFLARLAAGGSLLACGDDPGVQSLLEADPRKALTYGFGKQNRLRAEAAGTDLWHIRFEDQDPVLLRLRLPGRHNVLNALGALGMAMRLGVNLSTAAEALAGFSGVSRRLQPLQTSAAITLYDDFAHHPTEIRAALCALRPGATGRLIAVLQPQLHSRVSARADAFVEALSQADLSYLLPVSAEGESKGDGDAALLAALNRRQIPCQPVAGREALLAQLQEDLRPDDTLLVMAGTSGAPLAPWLAAALQPPRERRRDFSILHGPERKIDRDLLAEIAGHCRRNPTAPAVEIGSRSLSYADLLQRVENLAALLRKSGVKQGLSVGVCLGRSLDRLTSFLAILRLGAVYVPLDPQLPRERMAKMMQQVALRHVVVNAASPAVPGWRRKTINCGFLPDPASLAAFDWALPEFDPQSAGYIVFTSGTSGTPKAVEVPRQALTNYAFDAAEAFGITPTARVSQLHSFGFDVAIGDMIMAMAGGACLVLPTDLTASPGAPVGRFIARARITHLSLTPSALALIPAGECPDLTHVVVAGEPCPSALVSRWSHIPQFINAYGPSEATIEVSYARCHPEGPITIGRPFANCGICLLNAGQNPVPQGDEGEIWIFGEGLALGYRGQPELTAERFATVTLPGLAPRRMYRSGDRGRQLKDGRFLCLGRMDNQVKFKGYRIEPEEIEARICAFPGIADAAVSLLKPEGLPERLIAHFVMAPDADVPEIAALRSHLSRWLPAYMLPAFFLPVQQIPRSLNGKRERSNLPLPPGLQTAPAPRRSGTPTEEKIIALVEAQIGHGALNGVRDPLSDAGLDSIAMANLLFALEEAFDVRLISPEDEAFETVETLGLLIDTLLAQPAGTTEGGGNFAARLLPHVARWPGTRIGSSGLLFRIKPGPQMPGSSLFWCFQSGGELAALHEALGPQVALYGLRSGHLAVDYTPGTLTAMGQLYARLICEAQPEGTLHIGGNCQGGMVMRAVGLELIAMGREPAMTILMEQGRFSPYPAPVTLLFGERSYLNPYAQLADPDQIFRRAYPAGYSVDILPGAHGSYFTPDPVRALAAAISRSLSRPGGGAGKAPELQASQ
ncbi:amino acid adenylation domain-containing protein [Falsigemmobacter faecalis]|uniref:Amino acid adenylation domain-containing protein n=1 Tax=Falsigemmobacter faecalis TaxID=2488730 RepID=A0A3P3DHX5_9RHOB|nr:amino acid adenylation domain-containing protein [Falsigemmobacter faecalis]RRH73851.1 amino acid adenylation domain-containing protein [Falsigemmobacter faecalis]